jgi:hypothetical protein
LSLRRRVEAAAWMVYKDGSELNHGL